MAKKKQQRQEESEAPKTEEVENDVLWETMATAMVRSVGRPTKYKMEYAKLLVEYFVSRAPYQRVNTMFGPKEYPSDLPTIEGFAMMIGVHKDTLYEWEKAKEKGSEKLKHPEFSDAMKKARTVQAHILVTNGLRKNYEKTFAIFFGKNNLGMKDEQTLVHKGLTYDKIEKPPKADSPAEAKKAAEKEEW